MNKIECAICKCLTRNDKFCSLKCYRVNQKLNPNSGTFKKGQRISPKTEFKKGENLGENNKNWKGGRHKLKIGYVMVKAYDHPKAYRNEVYEHILVAEKKIGRYLKKGENVHHINGIKDDNRPKNLIVCKTWAEHRKYHRLKTWSKKYNSCWLCNKTDSEHSGFGICSRCYKLNNYHYKKCIL